MINKKCQKDDWRHRSICNRYMGTQGVYTHTLSHEKDAECVVCSPGVPMEIDCSLKLQKVCTIIQAMENIDSKQYSLSQIIAVSFLSLSTFYLRILDSKLNLQSQAFLITKLICTCKRLQCWKRSQNRILIYHCLS